VPGRTGSAGPESLPETREQGKEERGDEEEEREEQKNRRWRRAKCSAPANSPRAALHPGMETWHLLSIVGLAPRSLLSC
jgi:hypothetical protein